MYAARVTHAGAEIPLLHTARLTVLSKVLPEHPHWHDQITPTPSPLVFSGNPLLPSPHGGFRVSYKLIAYASFG